MYRIEVLSYFVLLEKCGIQFGLMQLVATNCVATITSDTVIDVAAFNDQSERYL